MCVLELVPPLLQPLMQMIHYMAPRFSQCLPVHFTPITLNNRSLEGHHYAKPPPDSLSFQEPQQSGRTSFAYLPASLSLFFFPPSFTYAAPDYMKDHINNNMTLLLISSIPSQCYCVCSCTSAAITKLSDLCLLYPEAAHTAEKEGWLTAKVVQHLAPSDGLWRQTVLESRISLQCK